jgi:hypothetical protein
MLCLLLLSACVDPHDKYEYAVTWECLSPEGCERADELALLDSVNIYGDAFYFTSSNQPSFTEHAQRVASNAVPDGCFLMYGLTLFGHELEPAPLCSTSGGYDLEFVIPNRNPATASQWLAEIRKS